MKDTYDQFAQMREEALAFGDQGEDSEQNDLMEQDAIFFG